jgi:hypothetical protein
VALKKNAEPMKWLEASLLWQEFLADHFFVKKWLREKKNTSRFFWKNLACLPFPKESDCLCKPH